MHASATSKLGQVDTFAAFRFLLSQRLMPGDAPARRGIKPEISSGGGGSEAGGTLSGAATAVCRVSIPGTRPFRKPSYVCQDASTCVAEGSVNKQLPHRFHRGRRTECDVCRLFVSWALPEPQTLAQQH